MLTTVQSFLFGKYLKSICALVLILFSTSVMTQVDANWKLRGDSEIGRKLAEAPENSWVKLNLNRFDSVWTPFEQRPSPPEAPSAGSPRSIILAWSSMAWDSNRGNIIIWGGGHANYPGNEPYIWRSSTLTWTRAALPSDVQAINPAIGQFEAIDGVQNAPIAAHTYDNSEFFPVLDRFVTFGGAAFNTGGNFIHSNRSLTGPYFFNPDLADGNAVGGTTGSQVNPGLFPDVIGKGMWDNRDNMTPTLPGEPRPSGFINGATAYANEGGVDVLYIQTGNDLFRYAAPSLSDSSQDTYDRVGVSFFSLSDQGTGAFDPERRLFVRTAGGNGGKFAFWDLSQAETIAQNVIFSPMVAGGAFNFKRLRNYGMDFDNVRKIFVLWEGNHDIWHLVPPDNLASGTWTLRRVEPQDSDGPLNSKPVNILGKWKYARALDAYIGLFDPSSGDIWAYKPTDWQPEAETNSAFIAAPHDGQTIHANETLEILASSLGNPASSIEYFVDGQLIGATHAKPHRLTWPEPTLGSHSLTIVVTHQDGTSSRSVPVNILVSSTLSSEQIFPEVSILANNSFDSTTLEQENALSLVVALDPGPSTGNLADYWVRAITPFGTFWLNNQLSFIRSDSPIRVFGGPLINLPPFTILNDPATELPPGTYTVTFAVDDNQDGIVNATFRDTVVITINQ